MRRGENSEYPRITEFSAAAEYRAADEPKTDMSLEYYKTAPKPEQPASQKDHRRLLKRLMLSAAALSVTPTILAAAPNVFQPNPAQPAGNTDSAPVSEASVPPDEPVENLELMGYNGRLTFDIVYGGGIWADYNCTMNTPCRHYVYYYPTPGGEPENVDLGGVGSEWDDGNGNGAKAILTEFFTERGLELNDAMQFFFTGDNYMSVGIEKETEGGGLSGEIIPVSALPAGWRITDTLLSEDDPEYYSHNTNFAERTDPEYGGGTDDDKSYYMSLRADNNDVWYDLEEENGYFPYMLRAQTNTFTYYVVPKHGEQAARPALSNLSDYDPSGGGAEQGYAGLETLTMDTLDLNTKDHTLTLRPSVMREQTGANEETLHYIIYYLYFNRDELPNLTLPYMDREETGAPLYSVDPTLPVQAQLAQMAAAYGIDMTKVRLHSEEKLTQTNCQMDGATHGGNPMNTLLEQDAETGKTVKYQFHKFRLVLEGASGEGGVKGLADAAAASCPQADPAQYPLTGYYSGIVIGQVESTLDDGTVVMRDVMLCGYGNPTGTPNHTPFTADDYSYYQQHPLEWLERELRESGINTDGMMFHSVIVEDHYGEGYSDTGNVNPYKLRYCFVCPNAQ